MQLPASLKSCRTRPSPAIRSSLCRSTPQPRTTCRGFVCSAFRRDRSKKNSKRCSSKANEETQQNCDRTARKKWCRPTSDATGRCPSWVIFGSRRSYPRGSALPPTTDIERPLRHVRFVPTTDPCTAAKNFYSITSLAGASRMPSVFDADRGGAGVNRPEGGDDGAAL